MASGIKIAPEYDNVSGLLAFLWSPDINGLEYPRIIDAASGDSYADGLPFVILRFPVIMTPEDWVDSIGKCGLSTARSGPVTIRLPDENKTTYYNYNGIAKRPNYGRDLTFRYVHYQGPTIKVSRLELIT